MSLFMLALLLGMCAWAGVDAWNDRTPRKPFDWRRPDLEWWTTKRTKRERARTAITMSAERTAQEVTTSSPGVTAPVHPASPSREATT